uniref:Uncharacterized protein n=1 Tax=Amphimedon queenslandica TaxID=400682 RepID=A0A1X7UZK5_AMPQE
IATESLSYILPFTQSLQSEAKDIVQAVTEIVYLKTVLSNLRENVFAYHNQWFIALEKTHGSNIQAETQSEYFQRVITIPIIDYIIAEINSHFSQHQKTALHGLSLIPLVLVEKTMEDMQ